MLWLVSALCLAVLGGSSAPVFGAAKSVSKQRKEAERLQEAIESTATKIEVLNEDYLDAQVRLAKFSKRMTSSAFAASQAETELAELRKRIRAQALSAYAHPPAAQGGESLKSAQNMNELERREAYARVGAIANFDAEDALRSSLATLNERRNAAKSAKVSVSAEVKTLSAKRQKADLLLKDYEVLETQARGELAALVRAAAEAAASREERDAQLRQNRRQAAARAELEKRRRETRKRLEKGASTGVGGLGAGQIPKVSIPGSKPKASTASSVTTANPLPPPTDPAQQSDTQLAIDAGQLQESPASPGAGSAVKLALAQLGKPYVWAADGPSSFDCSGLMLFAWRAAGVSLPHSSRAQFSSTSRVGVSQIRPGDLVFYGHPIHHVGMYVGGGKMVEASRAGRPVKLGSIFRRDLVGVGRVR